MELEGPKLNKQTSRSLWIGRIPQIGTKQTRQIHNANKNNCIKSALIPSANMFSLSLLEYIATVVNLSVLKPKEIFKIICILLSIEAPKTQKSIRKATIWANKHQLHDSGDNL